MTAPHDQVKVGGRYKHFKRAGGYVVIGIALHTETMEDMVVYQAQYDSPEFGNNVIWVRPLLSFVGTVEHEGKIVPRFEYLGE